MLILPLIGVLGLSLEWINGKLHDHYPDYFDAQGIRIIHLLFWPIVLNLVLVLLLLLADTVQAMQKLIGLQSKRGGVSRIDVRDKDSKDDASKKKESHLVDSPALRTRSKIKRQG